jgi:hypothetical protein
VYAESAFQGALIMSLITVDDISKELARCIVIKLNGIDITGRCYAFDANNGQAECFKVNEEGRKYLIEVNGQKEPATETLYGDIQIHLKSQSSWEARNELDILLND